MKFGFFDEKELQSPKDSHKSPFPHVVRDELLNLLNRIRREWGKPVIVNSGYRSPEYNATIPGAVPNSYHTKGAAADIRPDDPSLISEFQDLCLELNKDGGVGLYDAFVHVDVRGHHAFWDYRSSK